MVNADENCWLTVWPMSIGKENLGGEYEGEEEEKEKQLELFYRLPNKCFLPFMQNVGSIRGRNGEIIRTSAHLLDSLKDIFHRVERNASCLQIKKSKDHIKLTLKVFHITI